MARKRRYNRRKKVAKVSKPMKRAIKRIVRTTVQPELKYTDSALAGGIITSSGYFHDMTVPVIGTEDFNQRVGDKITCKGLQLRGYVRFNAATSALQQEFRFMIIKWHPDSAYDIISNGSIFKSLSNPRSLYVHDMRHKFTVLYDDYCVLNTTSGSNSQFKTFEIFKKLNSNVLFKNSGTSGSGKIYAYFLSSDAVYGPTVSWEGRVWYTDA